MTIDQPQREQALDWQQSFIVQAPAGSGKTELLIQRFLVLLAKVDRVPEQVVAITFTKKAAQEMRTRVLQALMRAQNSPKPEAAHLQKTWQLAQEVLARDTQENWQLLKQPNRLTMLTIDSFCAALTRQMPLVSRFGAMPEILEDAQPYYQQAAEKIWLTLSKQEKWKKSIRNLLWHFDNQLPRIQRLISELLARREQWLYYAGAINNADKITQTLKKHLRNLIDDVLLMGGQKFPKDLISTSIDLLSYAASVCVQEKIDNPSLINCLHITQLPHASTENFLQWSALAKFFLTNEGTLRKKVDKNLGFFPQTAGKTAAEKAELQHRKNSMLQLLEDLAKYPDFLQALQHIQQLPPADYAAEQQQILIDLLEVLALAAAQLMVLFQQNGVCDFNQLLQGALQALGTPEQPSDLALTLDYRIQHILVDEFQDTSVAQFRLLECLTAGWTADDGRTLFLVGDPMQSIYRFRQAEVGLFLNAWQHGLGTVKLTPLVLQVNFRSADPIVQWINQHMATAFPNYMDIGVGAVPFIPATAQQKNSVAAVNVYVAGSEDTEAKQVLTLVENALRDPQQEHIAILVRARSHLSTILAVLQTAGIAYQAVEIESLSTRAALQDLLALTRALLHPADKIAWLAILRAPWCGLTLKELTRLVEMDTDACILDNLLTITDWNVYSQHAQQVLPQLITIMQTAIAERQRLPISQWILNTWLALNGPTCYNEETLSNDVQRFFDLLESMGTEVFYLMPQELEERVNKLYARSDAVNSRVQVMTMHKAKGLEFDTVIIPGLHNRSGGNTKDLLTWWERPREDGNAELLIAALNAVGNPEDKLYNYIWLQQKTAFELELTRLLYVAMTRAKKYLHLTAVVDFIPDSQSYAPPVTNSLLHCIWDTVYAEVKFVEGENSENTVTPHLLRGLVRISRSRPGPATSAG
jgi:ATP-dependent helicase/nuclease subunit A